GHDDERPWLHTVAITGPTLESLTQDTSAVAPLVAHVATTLADLHELGVSHGAVEPSHILLHPDGRPVLCSLGRSEGTTTGDQAAAHDVTGLARLTLDRLAGPTHP